MNHKSKLTDKLQAIFLLLKKYVPDWEITHDNSLKFIYFKKEQESYSLTISENEVNIYEGIIYSSENLEEIENWCNHETFHPARIARFTIEFLKSRPAEKKLSNKSIAAEIKKIKPNWEVGLGKTSIDIKAEKDGVFIDLFFCYPDLSITVKMRGDITKADFTIEYKNCDEVDTKEVAYKIIQSMEKAK